MKKQILTFAIFTLGILITSASTMALECSALKGYDNGRSFVTVEAKLNAVEGFQNKLEAEVEDGYFTFTQTADGTYSAKIIMAPDYVNGVSTIANFDKNGSFTLAKISATNRFVLNCKK